MREPTFTLEWEDRLIRKNGEIYLPIPSYRTHEEAQEAVELLNLGIQTQERIFKQIMAALSDYTWMVTPEAEELARQIAKNVYE